MPQAPRDNLLLHNNESEALTSPPLAHAWAERTANMRAAAPGPGANGTALLEQLDRANRPAPGQTHNPVVLDNDPIQAEAPANRPWTKVEWRPRYAPGANVTEASLAGPQAHHLPHRTCRHTDDLNQAIPHVP